MSDKYKMFLNGPLILLKNLIENKIIILENAMSIKK